MVNAMELETLVPEWPLHLLSAILQVDDMQIVISAGQLIQEVDEIIEKIVLGGGCAGGSKVEKPNPIPT
jgi:hypothetical protein